MSSLPVSPIATRLAVTPLVLLGFLLTQSWGQTSPRNTAAPSAGIRPQNPGERVVTLLEEGWTVDVEGELRDIEIGDSWEGVLGPNFDGRATYSISASIPSPESGRHLLLEIDGAATKANVFINGQAVGSHLGGWTPFRMRLNEALFNKDTDAVQLQVEVDELVGHNTQGFLPIVVPHFGGIWKSVRIIQTAGPIYLDDLSLQLSGFDGSEQLTLDVPIRGSNDIDINQYEIGWKFIGTGEELNTEWTWEALQTPVDQDAFPLKAAGTDTVVSSVRTRLTPPVIRRWSPEDPFLYQIEIALRERESKQVVDRLRRKAAIRHFEANGRQLLVNKKPIILRGVLNWGYAPPRLAPSTDIDVMREELRFARDRGFNIMKFCLWMPPQEYLELADEMGMLTWIEYPTWHPEFSDQKLADLHQEFIEFFHYDRNHASVILRSLTCETGHSASIDVIRDLYETAHAVIPGAIVEDDSSWIEWHRIHDFYDDHPYGNNHTWLEKLDALDQHIRSREAKPLVLGEAIAADTWESASELGQSPVPLAELHRMRSIESQFDYLKELANSHAGVMERLRPDSFEYALEMRKYQIEAYRYRLPHAGYVVSVIRDFPLASMGLLDRDGNAKWSVDQFRWHGENQLVLNDGLPIRSIESDSIWKPIVSITVPSREKQEIILQGEWSDAETGEVYQHLLSTATTNGDGIASFPLQIPVSSTDTPWRGRLAIKCLVADQPVWNSWHLWVVPKPVSAFDPKWLVHQSVSSDRLEQLGLDPSNVRLLSEVGIHAEFHGTILASTWDLELLAAIERGANCVMLPSGSENSFALRDHWFLRGGPVVADTLASEPKLSELVRALQSFDLAGPVMFEFPWLDRVTPLLSLWDNHDLDHYRTHALVWMAQIGRGRLLVSTLDHSGANSPAGPFVLNRLADLLAVTDDSRGLSLDDRQRIRDELTMQQVLLNPSPWKFRRGAREASDVGEDWISEDTGSPQWSSIAIDRHWDGQGYGDLDGWGYYRVEVTLPQEMKGKDLYISFTGVDDYYDVFIEKQLVGSAGNMETRETAFELRTSHKIAAELTNVDTISIAVRVYDWQGAGGIFRNVYLGTTPIPSGPPLLVTSSNTDG